ncbi:MAG: TlpA family protein disulfide reductase [Steroidobacteraceae bacterium]
MKLAARLLHSWWLLSILFAAAAANAGVTGQQRAEAAGHDLVGSPAPRMVLKTIDGKSIDLGSLYGKKAVYLKFWATWCVPCREQMPHFERTYESAGSDLAVIAVNAGFNDSLDDVRTYRKQLGIKMPIVIDDGTLGAALNLRVTPQHVVIGRDGRIQYVGHLANERLDAAIQAARSSPPATATAGSQNGGTVEAGKTSGHGPGDGERAPQLSAKTLDGSQFNLQEPAGQQQPAVLVFLSPWCESYLETSRAAVSANCRDARVQVDALAKKHPQVRWLGIASGLWATKEDLRKYQTDYKVTIPLTLDESGALFRTFRVRNVPTVILIDTHGKIERRIEGSDPQLQAKLQAVTLER